MLNEKKLTPAEKKKREEIAQAIERDNPGMPMDKKMAIATATAKRVAEAMDDDDDDKSVDTSRTQRTGDFKMVKVKDPNTGEMRWRKMKKQFKVESVEIEEAREHEYSRAVKALKDYANKNGGIDKKDFHTAAKHLDNVGKSSLMQKGNHLAKYNNHVRGLDTDVRERIQMTLRQHGMMESVEENVGAPQTAAHRRAQLPKKVKLKGFGPDAAKGNMGNPSARAALKPKNEENVQEGSPERLDMIRKAAEKYNKQKKAAERKAERDAKKAMSKDADLGENNNASQGDKPPFEGPYTKASEPKKDKFGNTIKVQNIAKHLAKKAAAQQTNEAVHPDHVSLHPHKTDKKKYTVGQVGRNVKGRLKTGEHLNDTEVDDLHDMGMKVKHERGPLREADFDTNFKKRIALKVSGPKSVRDYMKKKVDQRKAAHAKQDPSAVKQGYGPGVIPPGTAYRAATKRGMNPSQAANAVSNAFKNRGKPRKLPEEAELHEGVIDTLNTIVKSRGAQEVKFKNGQKTKVDVQTANVLTKVHKSLNSTNAKKFADKLGKSQGDFMKLLDFAYTVTR